MTLRTPLWQHQRDAVAFVAPKRAAMLAMDMGTGKTLAALALMQEWRPKLTLITCPLSVLDVWEREIATHCPDTYDVLLLRGTPDKKGAALERAFCLSSYRPVVLLVNHESAWREPLGRRFLEHGVHLLIVDESHRAKAPGGKLSRWLAQMRRSAQRRLAMSGTVMPHSPLDIYAQYRFLDASIFGTSFARFRARYAVMGGFQAREVMGFQNLPELEARFKAIAYQVTKDECLDLPDEVDEVRRCALEPAAQRVYEALEREFWVDVGRGEVTAANALVKLLRLQQVTSGTLPLDAGGKERVSTAKAELLADVLLDVPPDEPVVVFTRFVQDLDAARRVADGLGRKYGEVSGRQKDLEAGRYPEGVTLLGVQIQSGGVGVDLTRARLAIFYSMGFSLGDYLQARARLHRPGQTRKVTHMHLVARSTIDEAVLGALRARQRVVEEILSRKGNAVPET